MNFDYLFLDTETFSPVDLKKSGAYVYAEHPETEIMLATYALDDGPVRAWAATEGRRMPEELRKALRHIKRGRAKLVMQNGLLFDRLLMRECWEVDIPASQIIDTMILAYRHALPGGLDALCEVLGVAENLAKDKKGKALIQRFCKPTPKNYKIRRYTRDTHPDEWRAFIDYAKSDISAMREVFYSIPEWGDSDFEDDVLALDIKINDRGFYVDTALATAAINAVKQHKIELQASAAEKFGAGLTGAAFLPMLRALAPGFDIPNAQKATLTDLVALDDFPDEARVAVEMRLGASSTASTKYTPLLAGVSRDGRCRGCLQYGGAKRTLRWGGRRFQPQNLARGYYHDDPKKGTYALTEGINALLKGRAHWLYDVSKLTATTVRSCVIPAPGKKLIMADFSNVEGRGLAWLAGEETALNTFRSGLDIYCVTAGRMFNLDPAYIAEHRPDLRQIGKVCELGLGYGGGVAAFLQFAKVYGLDLAEMAETMAGTFPDHIWSAARKGFEWARIQEKNKRGAKGQKPSRPSYDLPKKVWLTCDAIKRMWRESHPETVTFWAELEAAVRDAIAYPGRDFWAGDTVRRDGNQAIRITRTATKGDNGDVEPGWWLKVELPSGRVMSYPGIGISVEKTNDEDDIDGPPTYKERIRYMGENQITRQWGKQYTYGGKLAENITQALCRDLLANSMLTVDRAGWDIILHVHDEIVCETPKEPEYSAEALEALMCELPGWAAGFPVAAAGAELMRYTK